MEIIIIGSSSPKITAELLELLTNQSTLTDPINIRKELEPMRDCFLINRYDIADWDRLLKDPKPLKIKIRKKKNNLFLTNKGKGLRRGRR
jgi:hypothetical protein